MAICREVADRADLAEALNELLDSPEMRLAGRHWQRHRLAAIAAPALPLERIAAGGDSRRPLRLVLEARLPAAPEEVARRLDSTPEAVLLTAWGGLLARYLGSEEVTVATHFDGRLYPEVTAAVGPLARFVPVQVRGGGGAPFAVQVEVTAKALAEAAR